MFFTHFNLLNMGKWAFDASLAYFANVSKWAWALVRSNSWYIRMRRFVIDSIDISLPRVAAPDRRQNRFHENMYTLEPAATHTADLVPRLFQELEYQEHGWWEPASLGGMRAVSGATSTS